MITLRYRIRNNTTINNILRLMTLILRLRHRGTNSFLLILCSRGPYRTYPHLQLLIIIRVLFSIIHSVNNIVRGIISATKRITITISTMTRTGRRTGRRRPCHNAPNGRHSSKSRGKSIRSSHVATHNSGLNIRTRSRRLFRMLPRTIRLLKRINLFTQLFMNNLHNSRLNQKFVSQLKLNNNIHQHNLNLTLQLRPGSNVRRITINNIRHNLNVNMTRITLNASNFGFFRIIRSLSFHSVNTAPNSLPKHRHYIQQLTLHNTTSPLIRLCDTNCELDSS